MADLPDDLERLKAIAANLRHRLARIDGRIRRIEDEQWQAYRKERDAALSDAAFRHKPLCGAQFATAGACTCGVSVGGCQKPSGAHTDGSAK